MSDKDRREGSTIQMTVKDRIVVLMAKASACGGQTVTAIKNMAEPWVTYLRTQTNYLQGLLQRNDNVDDRVFIQATTIEINQQTPFVTDHRQAAIRVAQAAGLLPDRVHYIEYKTEGKTIRKLVREEDIRSGTAGYSIAYTDKGEESRVRETSNLAGINDGLFEQALEMSGWVEDNNGRWTRDWIPEDPSSGIRVRMRLEIGEGSPMQSFPPIKNMAIVLNSEALRNAMGMPTREARGNN